MYSASPDNIWRCAWVILGVWSTLVRWTPEEIHKKFSFYVVTASEWISVCQRWQETKWFFSVFWTFLLLISQWNASQKYRIKTPLQQKSAQMAFKTSFCFRKQTLNLRPLRVTVLIFCSFLQFPTLSSLYCFHRRANGSVFLWFGVWLL